MSQNKNSSSICNFNNVKKNFDTKLRVLQLLLDESIKFVSKHMEENVYLKYTKFKNRICELIDSNISVSKPEQLQITVSSLLDAKHISIENCELLKTFIDSYTVTLNVPSVKQPKNEAINCASNILLPRKQHEIEVGNNVFSNSLSPIKQHENEAVNSTSNSLSPIKQRTIKATVSNAQTSTTVHELLVNDDVLEQRNLVKHIIDIMAARQMSQDQIVELDTLVKSLAGSCISHDYMDTALEEQVKERLNEMQEITIAINKIDAKNAALEERNTELLKFWNYVKKLDSSNLTAEEIKKQFLIMKAMKIENSSYRLTYEKILEETQASVNKTCTQLINKLLAEQIK